MEYRNLGRAGVKVSRLCLGGGTFGERPGEPETIRLIHEALDAGINFIDTAECYTGGLSEIIIGKALKGRRDSVVLATKVRHATGPSPGPNDSGLSRVHIMRQVEVSLRRLQTDHIDLYQLHAPDPATPMEETLSVLTDLIRRGKVHYIGTSNLPAWQICESLWISERRNYERFVSEQPPYNLLWRGIERELLPFCAKRGLGVVSYSPLAGGWLTGKYRKGQEPPPDSRAAMGWIDLKSPGGQKRLEAVERLLPLAQECGVTLGQFSLAWVLANPAVTSPIIGPRTSEQLQECLGAVEFRLTEDVLRKVDEVAPPRGDL